MPKELFEFPASSGQRRLWFLEQMRPGSPIYNVVPCAVRIGGAIDVAALRQALEAVVSRHEALRTTFARAEGALVQVIAPLASVALPVTDLGARPPAVAEAEVLRLVTEEVLRPFDLARGPLLRATLLRLTDREHVFCLTMHHIVSDGWSVGVLLREVSALYGAFAAGTPAQLPDLPIQFADFSEWERQQLQGQAYKDGVSYWKQQLAGLPLLQFPADRRRPPVQSSRGATQTFELLPGLTASLRELGRRQGCTLFMTLLAAFQTLLHRYSGQDDIAVGAPIGNRNRVELEGLIGLFLNTLVLRTRLSGDPSFRELLGRVRGTALEAYAHQDVPFEKLVEELQPERDLSRTPLFQVAFVLQDTLEGALQLEGLTVAPLPVSISTGTAKFDLTLSLEETRAGLAGAIEYSTDLFEPATIRRLMGHFQTLLEGVVAYPDRRLSALPLLTADEREQLLARGDGLLAAAPQGLCLHQLFAAQVRRTPEAVAVVFENHRCTYQELDRRANALAHELRRHGVGPEVLVGLCVDRSVEMVVGLLAILKAGGAYLPLDPAYPRDRLAFLLSDARAPVVLAPKRLAEGLQASGARVVHLDPEAAPAPADEGPVDGARPANLAYVLYTSGSTGQPKGVLVSHENVARLLATTQPWFQFGPRDVWTMFHSYAFDFSVWELWGALLNGGCLVVVPYEVSRSPFAFDALLRARGVTVLNQTPSAFYQLLAAGETAGPPPDLRLVVFGGEALEPQRLRPWLDRRGARHPRLVNMYGITETTVHASYRPLSAADLGDAGSPLGVALPDLRLYLLDKHLHPVPVGVPGELYVGGAGLARGYLGRPDLTAERFLPDPFDADTGARMYRSGDRARRRPDGDLEYLGRVDKQMKIRGFRIEPGEVEAALREHPGVSEAVVTAREDSPGGRYLVAYVLPAQGPGPVVTELRRFLQERLPDYLVPSAFVAVAALPRTPSGKVDRRALPAPGPERPALEGAYVAPRTPAEQLLADIWAQVLGVRPVGVEDNFFSLGGDSIRSLQVLDLARRRGLAFDLPQLFRHQTVAALAAEVGQAGLGSEASAPTAPFGLISPADRALLPADVEDAYPLAQLQAGMLFHSELAPHSNMYHNTGGSWIRTRVPFCEAAFREAVQRTVDRHPVFRTSFDFTHYSEPLQLVHRTASLPVEVVDLRHLPFEEQEVLITESHESEVRRPFDLSRPTLLRFFIHLRTEDTFQFTITECHAIFDGWSYHSMIIEIFNCYAALLRNEPLPEEPTASLAYRDFIAQEQEALRSEAHKHYWSQKLSGCTVLQLPRWQFSKGKARAPQTYMLRFPIPSQVYDGLQGLVRSAAIPLKSLALAAHAKVLSLVSGQKDVLTGMCTNGRPEEVGGEKVFGLFLNTVPVRLRLGGGSWVELARQAFEAERELLPFRRYPLAAIQKGWGRQPMCDEVLFNYMDFHVYDDLDPSLGIEILPGSDSGRTYEGTHFTLTVHFQHLTLASGLIRNQLVLELGYDATELAEEQVRRLVGYYDRALTAIAQDPHGRYEDACLLSNEERYEVLKEWNATHLPYPRELCLHELVEAQVERTPGAVAVAWEGGELTYRELGERADRLARRLRRLRVGPDVLVGVCLERGPGLVVALLATLKAGGAYVPLDPDHPRDRLAGLLADAGVAAVLTGRGLAGRLPPHPAPRLYVDGAGSAEEADSSEADTRDEAAGPPGSATADNLAYVIYTSGSTGAPKGVAVSHQAVVNFLTSMKRRPGLTEQDRLLAVTTFSFDIAGLELYLPLLAGARIVLASPETAADGARLLESLDRWGVTVMQATPATWQLLLSAGWRGSPRLTILCGGDALPRPLAGQLRERGAALWNMYGPTETTVWSALYPVEAHPRSSGDGVEPIGRPIANTQLYVLDDQGRPVPPGVPGELYIGGEGLARGYLHRPELTAERFLPDPFGAEPGARLYRTGDRARQFPDGNLEFLGRTDDQVKVRGFRIEPGEVEAALLRHPAVRQAVVVARDVAPGARQLVAYVVADPARCPSVSELRRFIQAGLPEYMVPAAFVVCEALPLTPHGKVDRRALPEPGPERPALEGAYVAPRTPAEQVLADIWARVLRLERVGVEDNFFELGGDSIISLQIIAKARERGLWLTPGQLFEHATIAAWAEVAGTQAAPQAEQGPVTGEVPLTSIQRWFFEQDLPERHHYNQALLLEVLHTLDPVILGRAVQHLLGHHDALRLRFTPAATDWEAVQVVAEAEVPFERVDWTALPEAKQEDALAESAAKVQASLNLADGPLLRVVLFDRGGSRPAWLLLVIHHLAFDVASWHILLGDLQTAYEQLRQGLAPQLPPKTASFRQWAERLQEWAQSAALREELSYWLDPARARAGLLPADLPGGDNTLASVGTITSHLSAEETRALLQEVPRAYHTQINDVLLTALAQALARWTGQCRLLFDLEGHGREALFDDLDLSRTVGWFTALFPVFLELDEGEPPGEALKSVKEQLRRLPNRGVGYGALRYLCGDVALVEPLKSQAPAEVSFNYMGQVDRAFAASAVWRRARESDGPNQSQRGGRSYMLEVTGWVADGRLQLQWVYSRNLHHPLTIERLAGWYGEALRALIAHCQSPAAGGYTPSDFPLARFDRQELDELVARFSQTEES